uniref:Prostaglandin E synthase 3-like n=1 Tax=Hirondellea gigas TaxID=1518452 RepID=A0A2P2HW88_9CRUS
MAVAPPVTWAQRKNMVFMTICVEDCKDAVINIETDRIYFKGTGGAENKLYENTLELYGELDPTASRKFVRDRNIELFLIKKEIGPFWPHLLKQKLKQHWLKVDFSKWKDEDDEEEVDGSNPNDFQQMMAQMGNLTPGQDGMGKPSLDDLDGEDETDSDDEALPDLE